MPVRQVASRRRRFLHSCCTRDKSFPRPFAAKSRVLNAAAARGSEANLELAWGLLRPCLFPELLLPHDFSRFQPRVLRAGVLPDPGSAATAAGHIHLVPWLIQNCCPLRLDAMLAAAANHCSLEDMLQLWQQIGGGLCPANEHSLLCKMAEAAVRSDIAAIPKLSWLLSRCIAAPQGAGAQQQQQQQALLQNAAKSAASYAWQSVRAAVAAGLNVRGAGGGAQTWQYMLSGPLAIGWQEAAEWLVDVAGCPRPQQEHRNELQVVWWNVGWDGRMPPIRWRLGRGVPVHEAAVEGAANSGNLEAVQLLHGTYGVPLTARAFACAAGSRRSPMPTATWLLQAGCPMGAAAFRSAAEQGDADMVRWLAQVARCPWDEDTIPTLINCWSNGAGNAARLLPAVCALVEAGCPPGAVLDAGGVQGHASAALDAAVRRGHLPLARYLHEECGVGCGRETLAEAAHGGCEPMLQWRAAGRARGTPTPRQLTKATWLPCSAFMDWGCRSATRGGGGS